MEFGARFFGRNFECAEEKCLRGGKNAPTEGGNAAAFAVSACWCKFGARRLHMIAEVFVVGVIFLFVLFPA